MLAVLPVLPLHCRDGTAKIADVVSAAAAAAASASACYAASTSQSVNSFFPPSFLQGMAKILARDYVTGVVGTLAW